MAIKKYLVAELNWTLWWERGKGKDSEYTLYTFHPKPYTRICIYVFIRR